MKTQEIVSIFKRVLLSKRMEYRDVEFSVKNFDMVQDKNSFEGDTAEIANEAKAILLDDERHLNDGGVVSEESRYVTLIP